MQVAENGVGIKLPKGGERPPVEGPAPEWLKAYEPQVLEAIDELNQLMLKPSGDP